MRCRSVSARCRIWRSQCSQLDIRVAAQLAEHRGAFDGLVGQRVELAERGGAGDFCHGTSVGRSGDAGFGRSLRCCLRRVPTRRTATEPGRPAQAARHGRAAAVAARCREHQLQRPSATSGPANRRTHSCSACQARPPGRKARYCKRQRPQVEPEAVLPIPDPATGVGGAAESRLWLRAALGRLRASPDRERSVGSISSHSPTFDSNTIGRPKYKRSAFSIASGWRLRLASSPAWNVSASGGSAPAPPAGEAAAARSHAA